MKEGGTPIPVTVVLQRFESISGLAHWHSRIQRYIVQKVVHLIQYPNKKTNFKEMKLISTLKIGTQNLKMLFFTAMNQKVLQGIKKSFDDVHLDVKIY